MSLATNQARNIVPLASGSEHTTNSRLLRPLERVFERVLWGSRAVVLVAVAASLIVSIGMFFVATVDVVQVTVNMGHYASINVSAEEHEALRTQTVSRIVEVIDGYLLATIMLIFAFGLYELFISRINAAEGNQLASRILLIHSLDDLKDRLAKVVLLILVVKFFKHALQLTFGVPIDLLYLAVGIVLIAGALYLSHRNGSHAQGYQPGSVANSLSSQPAMNYEAQQGDNEHE